jgi:translocation and assembly module TamB
MSLTNPSTVQISINRGLMEIKNFFLQGPKNSISIAGRNFTADRMNVTIDAKADLHLLQMFAPFLEDVGGPIEISASIAGPFTRPEIIGTANISETYVKIKGFPHLIEKISTDISFSQSKILVNEIDGQMAGGTISGDGSLIIKGIRNLQTSIQAHFENISLNIPDKVRSVGDAELIFSGSWFPFTLSGTYHVHQGLFEKEFTENTGDVADIKQSHYLPKVLRDGNFEPVLLDLSINLDRPFVIKNSMFDGSVTGDLQVKGPPSGPLLFGKLTAERKSKLIFKDKLFDIQNAVVEFNTPDEINPQIFATATSRINEYDITLIAQGQSKSLNIKTSSVPPLSDQDIISLIALGVTSTSLSRTAGQQKAVAEQTGLEIGGAVLAKPINKQLESTIGFNLAVTSQYDSTRNISISKITLSKKISEKLKVSGSRPVGDMEGYDVKLEYLLNNNITAVGSFENKNLYDNTTLQNTPQETQSIFGLDIEFKREFK